MKKQEQPSAVIEGVEVFYVPGFEGAYSVSKCGRVWSHERVAVKTGKKAGEEVRVRGRWRKPCSCSVDGRPLMVLFRGGKPEKIQLHRIMAMTFIPDFSKSDWIDHIDRNPFNNSLENLRIVTSSQNKLNSKMRADNSSGFRGVNWNIKRKMWLARVGVKNKRLHLGYFENKEIAAEIYDSAAMIIHGDFAELNFPEKKQAQLSPGLLERIKRFAERL